MNVFWNQHRSKLALGVLIISAFALIATSSGSEVGTKTSLLTKITLLPATPALGVSSTSILAVSGFIDSFLESELEVENRELQLENARLREEKARLIGVLQENERLRKVLELRTRRPEFDLTPAKVIARDTSPYFRVLHIRIALEPESPIEPRMPVISAQGLVGQVHRVFDKYAEVIIVSDPRHRVDAIAQRTRAQAVVEGLGHNSDYFAKLSYLRDSDEVRPGDLMVTSGMGEFMPKELVIGTVKEVQSAQRGLFQEATIEPAVDFSRLEEVFVLTGVR